MPVSLSHLLSPLRGVRSANRRGRAMLYLRTASGDFINAAEIVALSPHRGDDSEEIAS
jgi:hypothetical protein